MLVFGGVAFPSSDLLVYQARSLRILRGFCCACPLCMAEGGPMLPAELVPLKQEPKVDGRHTGGINLAVQIPAVGRLVAAVLCWDREVCVLFFFFSLGGRRGES